MTVPWIVSLVAGVVLVVLAIILVWRPGDETVQRSSTWFDEED